ncbi:hypothetical protein Agub_g14662 [Astrephomene gubernaculifera]|uniref:EF-hand domain-containing protein n=1 Tax=Astrephomene gubernaculifera TaxID=47775 RepID=A0AAD3HTD0_9CHLO|nr:hypothetical protein Agub_g14662 [Astrephomene gubernaculifera]
MQACSRLGGFLALSGTLSSKSMLCPPARRQLASVLVNHTFLWAIIVLVIVVGLALLAVLIWAIVTKCGRAKSAPVVPTNLPEKAADVERGVQVEGLGERGSANRGANTPPPGQTMTGPQQPAGPPRAGSLVPVPPWVEDPQRLPPGIVLAPLPPVSYSPLVSNPRLPGEPPYERLVLISSRVHQADRVARAVLPNVAYVVYDWKNFTLQELIRYVRRTLGPHKVLSIAVVAPGNKPGTVGLLEGAGTSPEKLATKTELSQFWRVLSGCVALSGTADGRRIDLLGCRVVEAPREGAALLKELWNLTTVPFAAADDALGGYMLCTFMEEPVTKQLSLIACSIPAIDLYFNRYAMLGITAPDGGGEVLAATAAAAAPLPPGPPPPEALVPVGTAPPLAAAHAPAPAGAAPAPAPAAPAAIEGAVQAHAAPSPPQQQQQLQPPAQPPPASVAAAAPSSSSAVPVQAAPQPPPSAVVPAAAPAAAPPPAAASQPPPAQAALPQPASTAPPAQPPASPSPAAATAAATAAAPTSRAAARPSPSVPGQDVFSRLSQALLQRGLTPEAAFALHDRDRNGKLTTQELTALMRAYVPDATAMDIKHFHALMQMDTDQEADDDLLTQHEFVTGLPENVRIQEAVRAGRDDDEVVLRLQEYLTENEAIIRDTFKDFDENGDGFLDHSELQQLVACIPGLDPHEKKFVMAFLYHHDHNKDARISLDELQAALAGFASPAPAVAHAAAVAAAAPQQPQQQQQAAVPVAAGPVAAAPAPALAAAPAPAAALVPPTVPAAAAAAAVPQAAAAAPPAVPLAPPALPAPSPALPPPAMPPAASAAPAAPAAAAPAPGPPPKPATDPLPPAAAAAAPAPFQAAAQQAAAAVQDPEQQQPASEVAPQVPEAPLPLLPRTSLSPLAPLAPLSGLPLGPPLGGRLAPLAPLAPLGGLPRPGALAPLAPLGQR